MLGWLAAQLGAAVSLVVNPRLRALSVGKAARGLAHLATDRLGWRQLGAAWGAGIGYSVSTVFGWGVVTPPHPNTGGLRIWRKRGQAG